MKTIGWMLVVIGAGWLLLNSMSAGPIFRAIVVEHHEAVPQQASFTREAVCEHMTYVARDLYDHRAWIATPTLVMIVGFNLILLHDRKRFLATFSDSIRPADQSSGERAAQHTRTTNDAPLGTDRGPAEPGH